MPNPITNLITFGSDRASLAAFQHMAHEMSADGEPLGSFDFNKLIPMPASLDIEEGSRTRQGLKLYQKFMQERTAVIQSNMSPAQKESVLATLDKTWHSHKMEDQETWELGEQAYNNLQKYGHTTWYSWCYQNWGTKWNSYRCRPLGDDDDTMRFQTAWSAVPNLMKKLSAKYPEQTITYCWADEDVGNNVGELVLKGGEIMEDHTPIPGTREAYEMASDILGIDLAEFGLYLNKDGSNYEYQDELPREDPQKEKGKKKSKGRDQSR